MPSYRESHVSGKGVPKSKEINIGMPQSLEDGREFHKSEQVKRGEIVPER